MPAADELTAVGLAAELQALADKAFHPNPLEWYLPWRVVPNSGKPTIASSSSGNLFRGFIGTWQDADLVVALVNNLPTIIAALSAPKGGALDEACPTPCETGGGHCCCECDTCCDCEQPRTITPDWLNADTCLENVAIALSQASLEDENGPVDTVVSSGDLHVVFGLACAARHARKEAGE